jgi:hypothetical protein
MRAYLAAAFAGDGTGRLGVVPVGQWRDGMSDHEQMVARQKVLAGFGDFALCCEDLEEVLTQACRLVGEALGTNLAKILEIEQDGQRLLVKAGVGWRPGIVGEKRLPMGERSSETYSIQVAQPVITQDIGQEDRFVVPDFLKEHGAVALVNVPIFLPGGQAYGPASAWDGKKASCSVRAGLGTPAAAAPE